MGEENLAVAAAVEDKSVPPLIRRDVCPFCKLRLSKSAYDAHLEVCEENPLAGNAGMP